MSLTDNKVDSVHYMGFQSYGVHAVSTKKPGLGDFYTKNAYKDISDYNKRCVDYFDDKIRYDSIYKTDYVKKLKQSDYTKGPDQTLKTDLANYEYSYDPNLVKMANKDKEYKKEAFVREKFAETQRKPSRQMSFSNWTTTYGAFNKKTEDEKSRNHYTPSRIDEHFMSHYHRYHVGNYKNEYHTSMGTDGDIPFEKFFFKNQEKIHSSNYDLSQGTTKPNNLLPGYCGYVPVNKCKVNDDKDNDPYFKFNKTIHMLTYKNRVSSYQGYIPTNPQNIKGNTRPFCLSTRGETFN